MVASGVSRPGHAPEKLSPIPVPPSRQARCGIAIRRSPYNPRLIRAESMPFAPVARRGDGNSSITTAVATLHFQPIPRPADGPQVHCPNLIRKVRELGVARPLRRVARVMPPHSLYLVFRDMQLTQHHCHCNFIPSYRILVVLSEPSWISRRVGLDARFSVLFQVPRALLPRRKGKSTLIHVCRIRAKAVESRPTIAF